MRGTTGDIRQLDLGLMKSPYAGSRCKHSVTRHLQVWLISSFKKYRLSSGDIWDDLQTLEDARWESRFSFFFALRPCCCHCSKSANQEHDPLGPCRGKDWNYIALKSGLFWAPTESDRGQAAGSSHSFVLSAGDPSCPRYHCCLTGLHTAPATLQPVGRMLCTTSPGECVGTPDSIQVCLAFNPDAYVEGQELLPRQAAGISVQTGLITPWDKLDPPFNVTTTYEAQVCVDVRTCIFMRVKLCLSPWRDGSFAVICLNAHIWFFSWHK